MSRYITVVADPIPQNTTPTLRCQLVDDQGNNIPKSALLTCQLTLYSPSAGVINALDGVDIMSSVTTDGAVAYTFAEASMVLISESNAKEKRVALVEWSTSTTKGKHEWQFHVANLGMVP